MNTSLQPRIVFDNVTLRVNGTTMFEGTNWTIYESQHWHISGPNGSGKTILAAAICRKIPLTTGRIRYFFDPHPGPGRLSLNPGEIYLISANAGRDLVRKYAGYHQARWQSFEGKEAPKVSEFLLGTAPMPGFHQTPVDPAELHIRRDRMRKAVSRLKISNLLERNIIHLSNGEARKILLARALMQTPKLLILDDPFLGLDVSSRKMLRDVIENIISNAPFQLLLLSAREDEIPNGISHLLRVDSRRIIVQGARKDLQVSPLGVTTPPSGSTLSHDIPSVSFPPESSGSKNRYVRLVEMEDTSVSYHGIQVLNGINWCMNSGEHWALLGHNGAGKTTLLSLILGDNPQAYANRISLFDRRRGTGETIWDIKKKIGFVSPELQQFYLRNVSCLQTVCSGFFDSVGLYRTCSADQVDLAHRWLSSIGIDSLSNRPFNNVSAGEQRLVLIARALVKNPVLLVLDEPCQGLDAHHRRYIIALLDRLCSDTSVSMIFVTHHENEMPDAITHVIRLSNGCIETSGKRSVT